MNESMKKGLRTGSIGERVAWDILQHDPKVRTVFDVRLAPKYQELDVDFEVEFIDRRIYWVEVKTDEQIAQTGNIFYEITSNENYDTQGCFDKTKADVMFIYDSQQEYMYQVSVPGMKRYVDVNKNTLRKVKGGDHAIGLLIKMDELINSGVAKRFKDE